MAFTVQLTAQRDSLVNDLDEKRFQLKQSQEAERLASSGADSGLRQRKRTATGTSATTSDQIVPPRNVCFSLYYLF